MVKEIGILFNKETAATGHIHVCSAGISPCDDPTCENANSITGAAEGAVEFDGPSHFFTCTISADRERRTKEVSKDKLHIS